MASPESSDFLVVPHERIGVIIGIKGKTKREIEKKTETKLEIDSKEGEVEVIREAKRPGMARYQMAGLNYRLSANAAVISSYFISAVRKKLTNRYILAMNFHRLNRVITMLRPRKLTQGR